MKNFNESLINSFIEPVDRGWVLPIASGRFILTENYDVIDTGANDTLYVRDRATPLATATLTVPVLTGGAAMNVAYLFALAVKPLVGLTDAQLQANTGCLPTFLNSGLTKEKLEAADVAWLVPDGGFAAAATKLFVPGFGKYYVNSTAFTIHLKSDDTAIVAGTNRGRDMALLNDQDELVEVDAAHFVLHAHGKLTAPEYMPPLFFTDLDGANLDPANITTVPAVVNDASGEVADNSADWIATPGDGQP